MKQWLVDFLSGKALAELGRFRDRLMTRPEMERVYQDTKRLEREIRSDRVRLRNVHVGVGLIVGLLVGLLL